MRTTIILTILFLFNVGHAFQDQVKISPQAVKLEVEARQEGSFAKIRIDGQQYSKQIGAPELPIKNYLFKGTPESLNLSVKTNDSFKLANTIPFPAQPEKVRNQNAEQPAFAFNNELFQQNQEAYTVQYLGDYRGTPVTQVIVPLAKYSAANQDVTVYSDLQVNTTADKFVLENETNQNYLIIVSEDLSNSLTEFVAYKESLGFTIFQEVLQSPEITSDNIKTLVANHYAQNNINFVLFVGDAIPFLSTSTSGSSKTPTDLYYFTMGGAGDFIPEVFAGRIPGSTETEIMNRLNKSMEFDKKAYTDSQGLNRVIGIASNEGYGPSDDDYIKEIEQAFVDKYSFETTHFQQDNSDSNPDELNRQLGIGAAWMFYVGHGSGYSWPSMYREYSVSDISDVQNKGQVKPIIIDVACMNGRVEEGYLGSTFSLVIDTDSHGAAAYYGGTVNISWHPPAIMAQGIAFNHKDNNYNYLGEAILSGQLYLVEKHSSKNDVQDNFEWYVLQGDPSLNIKN